MTPTIDPRVQRIIDAQDATDRANDLARREAERPALLEKWAAIEAAKALNLPPLERDLEEKRAIAWRTHLDAEEAGNREHNEKNRLEHAAGQVLRELGDRPPAIVRAELARYDAEIGLEKARILLSGEAQAKQGVVLRALDEARGNVAALAALPDDKIPARIKAIRAGLPASLGGETWSVLDNVKQMGAELRASIAARFTTN